MRFRSCFMCGALLLIGAMASAQDMTVTAEKLNDHLYRLVTNAYGTTICVASVGADGILLVDTGVEPAAPKLKEALAGLGGKLAAIILTHEHADHTGGLALLGGGVPIYAHPKVREELTSGDNVLRELPEGVLPNKPVKEITTLRFNGEDVRIIPVPGGHSDTDLVVLFTGSKVACLGGFGNPAQYPYVDRAKGGAVAPYPELAALLLKELPPGTVLLPGHADKSDMAALKKFHEMLVGTCHAVQVADVAGKDFKTLNAKELFKGYESFGQGFVTHDRWLKTLVEGKPGMVPPSRKSLMEPLHRALKEKDVDAVVTTYRELKAKEAEVYGFNENVLNTLGYHLLLNKKRPADAIVIFKLNVEEYPKAYNVYDSLGEAYMANGQLDLSKNNYQKALELNPEFENAKAQLRKLQGMEAKAKQAVTKS